MESRYAEIKHLVLTFGVISWVILLIAPMPAMVIDILLTVTIAFSFFVLIKVGFIRSWEDFRTFPMLMIFSTIFRISLSIATTRKIINGEDPGSVIQSSGHLIVQDNIAIGLVMIVVLLIVSFIISFGANRFGEVSARFTLDALPGKQMSLDNDLNQGVIDAETHKKEKTKLQEQVDYYGSLDGAGKYIKGDVWASVTTLVINLVVGLIVGVAQLNLTFIEAVNHFTMLSVGDGVVMLICALMITASGAIVMGNVQKKNGDIEEGEESFLTRIFQDLIPNSRNLFIVGGILILLAFIGLPFGPMFFVGGLLIFAGIVKLRGEQKESAEKIRKEQEKKENTSSNTKVVVNHEVQPIVIEMGYKLKPLVVSGEKNFLGQKKEDFKDKSILMRKIFANKFGFNPPTIKIHDNISIGPTEYQIKIKESLVAKGVIEQDRVLAIPSLLSIKEIEGKKTKDPVYGQDAIWIKEEQIDEATEAMYDVWNPLNIVVTHLHTVLENNLWQLVSLQKVSDLVNEIGKNHPILKEKMDKVDELHLLQKVLISLLKEKVSIKDLPTIVEAFLEANSQTKDVDTLVSLVRQRISRQICENYINEDDGKIYLLNVQQEDAIAVENFNGHNVITMDPLWQQQFLQKLKMEKETARSSSGVEPVLIVNRPELRPALSKMLGNFSIDMPVVSAYELPTTVKNHIIGTI